MPPGLAQADAYRAENHLRVYALGPALFEVVEARGEGARGMWCAAASYAEKELRHDPSKRLYVARARGASQAEPGRKGVVFTTDPGLLPANAIDVPISFATTRTVGISLPSAHARQFCRDRFGERDRWRF